MAKQIKCKFKNCTWTHDGTYEAEAMAKLRNHWSTAHASEYGKIKTWLADFDNNSRFCSSCGKSQLSAGFIDTCGGCLAWFCPECADQHSKCSRRRNATLAKAA